MINKIKALNSATQCAITIKLSEKYRTNCLNTSL